MDDNEELEPFITGYLNQPRSRRVTAPQTAPPHHTRSEQEEAVAYLNMVKAIFHDRMEKYSEFLDVMKGFRRGRIDTEGVVVRVKELFEGHDELILGFNSFLPDGCKIEISQRQDSMASAPEGTTRKLTMDDASAYLKLVRTIFEDRIETYHEFLDVLKDYKSLRIDTEGVVMRVKELFEGHNDLILGFNSFLPDGYEIKLPEEHAC